MSLVTQQVVVCLSVCLVVEPPLPLPRIESAFADDLQSIAVTSHLHNLFIQKSFFNLILTYLSFVEMIIFEVIFLNKFLCAFLVCTRTHLHVSYLTFFFTIHPMGLSPGWSQRRGSEIFQKSGVHLKIPGVRWMT